MKVIRLKISEYCSRLNLTHKQLAGELGVERETVSKWNSGKMVAKMPMLLRLADRFGCNVNDLFEEKTINA